jgi:DNA-binding transcriptional ArsR family regulator
MSQATHTAPESSTAEPLATDVVYDALADKRRRYALHYLKQRAEPVTIRELSEQVAAWENDKQIEALTSQERKRVYIALYQSHLSTLDGEGLVDYDADAGTVELSDAFAEVDLYIEVVPRASVPWSYYYLGLALANAVVIGLAWGEVAPFDLVPELGWAALVLVTFALSAFVQTATNRRMRFGDAGPPPELSSR